jgi:CheY-like chemotaxis protein
VRVDGRQLLITVKDTGSGCDPGALKEKRDDLGAFGLLDIEDRVNFLGGAMNVECASGKGFCVMLWVPRDVTCSSDTHQPTSDVSRSSGLKPDGPAVAPVDWLAGRSIRVMIADDHQIMRDGLAELINGQDGIDVVGMAANGQEVVELSVKLRPDVILMDVSMPVMNGIDATKQIRASLPSVRIIGLTMHKDPDIHQAMLTAGACACHLKSDSPEELIKTIQLATSGRTKSSRVS